MGDYIGIIKIALGTFPLIAFIFTIPYILHNYHKYGSIKSIRILIVYSFILYLICVYFLVILPLPSREEVALMTGPRIQPIPFSFVRDIIKEYKVWQDGVFLFNPAVLQILYNVLMTIPFGMYLKYYFEFSFKKTLRFSLYLTLFFEVTQLSGLYFMYPRSYRLFDVDDLMSNTLGGVLGYLLVIPFLKILPTRQEIDQHSFERGKRISLLRRATAFGIDIVLVEIINVALWVATAIISDNPDAYFKYGFVVFCIVFVLLPIIMRGQTPGMRYTKLRIVGLNGKARWYQIAIRNIFYYVVIELYSGLIIMVHEYWGKYFIPEEYMYIVMIFMISVMLFFLMVECFLMLMQKRIVSERVSRTKIISTINVVEASDVNVENVKHERHKKK